MYRTKFATYFQPVFEAPNDNGGGNNGTPWFKADAFKGLVDDHTIGYWQNRYPDKLNDPAQLALATSKAHREAEAKLGIPSHEVLRVPSKPDDAGWANVWERLGVPKDAKDYTFKGADGKDLEGATADTLREIATKGKLTKEAAQAVAEGVLKLQSKDAETAKTIADGKIAEERTKLQTNWGNNFAANKFIAGQAVAKLAEKIGAPELAQAMEALEKQIGYGPVMEMFRVIGVSMGESKFVNSDGKPDGGIMSVEQAKSKREELKRDQGFVKRWNSGDVSARSEMAALDRIIAGAQQAA